MIKINGKKDYSEIIVNYIINKIISLTITRSVKMKIENQIPDKCFNYVKDTINNTLSTFFIFYDKDEERNKKEKEIFNSDIEEIKNENINNINEIETSNDENNLVLNNYFFNNIYSDENNCWDLMDEPISSKLDRYSTTLIKFQEKNAGLESKYKINQEKILEEEESDISKTKYDSLKASIKSRKSSKINLFRYSINNYKEENKKIKMSEIMGQLHTVDLEPEENFESKQIMKLRRIFEKSKEEKEKENLINKNEKEKMKAKQKLDIDNFRKYAGKKINKDHNGEIIFIKGIKANSLKKDFIISNSKFKTLNNIITKPKTIEKNKEIKVEVNKEEEREDKRNREMKYNKFKKLKLANDKNSDLKSTPKKNAPLITSGSNFFLMNMEVGVSLKEDEKFKTGGLDFFNKYKKFSIQVYDKKLKEAQSSNIYMKNFEILNEPKTQTIEEMNNLYKTNYALGNSTYDAFSSSILNNDTNIYNRKGLNNIMSLTGTNNSSIFKNYTKQANMTLNKTKNNLNLTPIMNMKLGASSLLTSFDKLNLISNEENLIIKKSRNIFRHKLSRKSNQNILNDMNNFTKNLMMNNKDENYGENIINNINNTGKIKGISHPDKPNIKEIIQEIGLKGKLTRERKFLPAIKSSFLDNENFFKH